MERGGYHPRLAAGVVAASGTFACMIPPSGLMVVYAIMAEVSVGRCLMADLIPGLITAVLYAASLYVRVKRDPKIAGGLLPRASWRERIASVPPIWGVFVMAFSIIGGIFLGLFTPTEAGAVGAAVGFILLMSKKNIAKWLALKQSLLDAGRTTAMVLFILIGVILFAQFLALSRLTNAIIDFVTGLTVGRYTILIGFMVIYVIGGMFLNATALLLLSMSIIYPVVMKFGFDPFWFGVLVMKTIEIGQVTPPVGITAYVVHGVARHIPLEDIFRGTLHFILMDFVMLGLVMTFPQIALFLPNLVK
jgi:tripartite ATP-independent transporter DctM subunit